GRLLDVLEPADDADRGFREQLHDMGDSGYFYRFAIHAFRLGALSQLDWRRFREELQGVRREARATENVHTMLAMTLNQFLSDEIAGQPELSVVRLDQERSLLPTQRFTVLHILHMTAVLYAACSTGQHARGFECLTAFWGAFERSPLRRIWTLRLLAYGARARLFLNEYVRSSKDPALLQEAKKSTRAFEAHQRIRLLARIAYVQDDRARALALLEESASAYSGLGYEPEVLRDRAAIGLITGGEQGEEMTRAAFDKLEQRYDCRDARRNAQAHFPELLGSL
ncbi:MAG TPA: hypothetical protein VJV78_37270, partial [Polyangiales bacterium]|nr:hypothetical protein [Polyangiales bacterium]